MLKLRRPARKMLRDERGQALAEFIMLVPLILSFVWYLVHVGVAINKSIVGQKHARSQLFLKMYNHRSGPAQNEFGNTDRSHFYIGVGANVISGSGVRPESPIEVLGIRMAPAPMEGANDDKEEPPPGSLRQRVRIRTAFGICTHRKRLSDNSGLTDYCGSRPNQ